MVHVKWYHTILQDVTYKVVMGDPQVKVTYTIIYFYHRGTVSPMQSEVSKDVSDAQR